MENPNTGGAATIGRNNMIQTARLRALRSHQWVAQQAAANCTEGWPEAGSWEAQAQQEGRWIEGDPTIWARQDSLQQSADNFDLGVISYGGDAATFRDDEGELAQLIEENQTAADLEREAWYELDTAKRLRRAARMRQQADSHRSEVSGLRVDSRMDAVVADRCIDVVQALAAVSRAWPRLGPKGRALAQQATYLASLALKQAGVKDQSATYAEAL
jgi:hypothetical protein